MHKIPKNYRLSPMTCRELQRLKELVPDITETELIERAISLYLCYLEPPFNANTADTYPSDQPDDLDF